LTQRSTKNSDCESSPCQSPSGFHDPRMATDSAQWTCLDAPTWGLRMPVVPCARRVTAACSPWARGRFLRGGTAASLSSPPPAVATRAAARFALARRRRAAAARLATVVAADARRRLRLACAAPPAPSLRCAPPAPRPALRRLRRAAFAATPAPRRLTPRRLTPRRLTPRRRARLRLARLRTAHRAASPVRPCLRPAPPFEDITKCSLYTLVCTQGPCRRLTVKSRALHDCRLPFKTKVG
jgi:hypothetical protein